jgi:ubiquinone/menaquinone biosynthesis C-methylase UbiE
MGLNYYTEIASYYNHDACTYDERYWGNPVIQQMRQSFREEVKRYSGITMLEIGCGTGLDLLHFSKTHPDRKMYGIDVSSEMIRLSKERINMNNYGNIEIVQSSNEDIQNIFPDTKFDIIYVFFGALNTVENLQLAAEKVQNLLSPDGTIVLSVVNKWYILGMVIDLLRFRFKKAFARLKPVWGGYSPDHFLPSHCYSPGQVKKAFDKLYVTKQKGYCIIHPAWYFTKINRKLGKRISGIFWKIDILLNKTFLWRFGEYTLFVFQH